MLILPSIDQTSLQLNDPNRARQPSSEDRSKGSKERQRWQEKEKEGQGRSASQHRETKGVRTSRASSRGNKPSLPHEITSFFIQLIDPAIGEKIFAPEVAEKSKKEMPGGKIEKVKDRPPVDHLAEVHSYL